MAHSSTNMASCWLLIVLVHVLFFCSTVSSASGDTSVKNEEQSNDHLTCSQLMDLTCKPYHHFMENLVYLKGKINRILRIDYIMIQANQRQISQSLFTPTLKIKQYILFLEPLPISLFDICCRFNGLIEPTIKWKCQL